MKKLSLRSEHLGELSADDLSRVAGAQADAAGTVSGGSCVCTEPLAHMPNTAALACDVSAGSCVCFCPVQTQ